MPVERLPQNPLLSPEDLQPTREDLEVMCTLNPAAVRFGDETLLLVRVGERPVPQAGSVSCAVYDADRDDLIVHRIGAEDPDLDASDPRKVLYRGMMLLTSLSHLRIARQTGDGFRFDDRPAIFPATPYEAFGCEDPRITFIDGQYYITYTAVSRHGVCVGLAVTSDFKTFTRQGIIFPPYQKDVCIFPRRVRRRYVCRHRPYRSLFNPACIWTAWSPDLRAWGDHVATLAPSPGTWEGGRVGGGAPPIETDSGWLEIYHAADESGRYALGAMLSDLDHPERIISRCERPVLAPQEDYELAGVYANCVFSNGLLAEDDGRLTIYYGAGDRVCAAAVTTIDEMIAAAEHRL